MHLEEFREYCITKKGVTESLPFDNDTLVFKVMNKMFALSSISNPTQFNLKCDPEKAIELRERYDGSVIPGYHMNKHHWNTVICSGTFSDKELKQWIDDSYNLIVASLPKKLQMELQNKS